MGCGTSKGKQKDLKAAKAATEQAPLVSTEPERLPDVPLGNVYSKPSSFGWGQPGVEVIIDPPDARDPAFLQTIAPSGTTWGQYVRICCSFVDPKTGFLAGPWAECIAWAVLFEHTADWDRMPQYHQDGVVGPVLEVMEEVLRRHPRLDKATVIQAAEKLEDAAHWLAESGDRMPEVRQVVLVPRDSSPGSTVRCENPQAPGSHVMVKVPSTAQPAQPLLLALPVQPSKSGPPRTVKVPFPVGATSGAMPGDLAAKALYRDGEGSSASDHCMGHFLAEVVQSPGFLDSLF